MNEERTFLGNGWNFSPTLHKDGTPTQALQRDEIERAVVMFGQLLPKAF